MTHLKLRRQLPYRPTERMNVVSYPIRDIVMEAKREEAKGKKMIYLNIGDPPQYGFEPFRAIAERVKSLLDENCKGYAPSEGDEQLRTTVAKIEKCRPEDVFTVAGLTEGIDFFFHSFIGFGEKVLLPNPVYPLYLSKAKQFEGDSIFYRHDADGQIDVGNLAKKIEGAKAIVIINPNNPLGSSYSEENLSEVVNLCAENDVPIFYDGSYDQLIFDGKLVDFRKIARDKVPFIYGSSLSKDFSYPGARIGWVAFHGDRWEEVKNAFFLLCNQRLSVNWEYQKAAAAASRTVKVPAIRPRSRPRPLGGGCAHFAGAAAHCAALYGGAGLASVGANASGPAWRFARQAAQSAIAESRTSPSPTPNAAQSIDPPRAQAKSRFSSRRKAIWRSRGL